ncbi:MAG: HEAT repeat domain-containing protein [Deltaproteobacteria bacterium]|nr:HEAT repeat domain-containing protein [Deltaproteobacteria bacterium]
MRVRFFDISRLSKTLSASLKKFQPGLKLLHWFLLISCLLLTLPVWIATNSQNKATLPVASQLAPDPNPLAGRETPLFSDDAQDRLSSAIITALTREKVSLEADSVASLAAILLDVTRSLKVRRQAAWRLAKLDSNDALAALRQSLMNGPPQLKATVAEALGHSADPQAKTLLASLLQDESDIVIRGAIRGLAAVGDAESVRVLAQIGSDHQRNKAIRTEAAFALGEIDTSSARKALLRFINETKDREFTEAVLSGLGRQPFDQTGGFFRAYVDSPDVETEMRAVALESLGQTTGAVAPFLVKYLGAEEPELRAAAAWAIANLEDPGDLSKQLLSQLLREKEPEVRTRIYQALEHQQITDAGELFALVIEDKDAVARLAGFKLLAAHSSRGGNQPLAAQFDELIVPRLVELGIEGADAQTRLSSVIALRQARTPQALKALEVIATRSQESKIIEAARFK